MNLFMSYILISSIILLCLYLTYKWLLANETFYRFNRCYLLLSLVAALTAVPAAEAIKGISFGSAPQAEIGIELGQAYAMGITDAPAHRLFGDSSIMTLFVVYLIGVAMVLIHTAIVGIHIRRTIKSGERDKVGKYTLVVTENSTLAPFSICGHIIVNRADLNEASRMIIGHEISHQRNLHWADLFLAQTVIALQWFNPAAWLMRRELRTVHEYQADMGVIARGGNMKEYQLLLIKKAIGDKFPALANCLNHSNLKKRITMMLKSKSSPWARMRALAAIPAVIAVAAVCNPDAIASALTIQGEPESAIAAASVGKDTKKSLSATAGSVNVISYKSDNNETPAPKAEKAVKAEAKAEPTYILDGVVIDKKLLESVDPEEIMSMRVAKDQNKVFIVTKNAAAKEGKESAPATSTDKILTMAEVMPEYPGGMSALMQFVAANIHYPQEAYVAGVQGRVVVQFVVSKTGKVTDPKIIRSQGEALDAAAIDVINKLPDFTPGLVDGKPVACHYTLPISFKITSDKDNK